MASNSGPEVSEETYRGYWDNYYTWLRESREGYLKDLATTRAELSSQGVKAENPMWSGQLEKIETGYTNAVKELREGATAGELKQYFNKNWASHFGLESNQSLELDDLWRASYYGGVKGGVYTDYIEKWRTENAERDPETGDMVKPRPDDTVLYNARVAHVRASDKNNVWDKMVKDLGRKPTQWEYEAALTFGEGRVKDTTKEDALQRAREAGFGRPVSTRRTQDTSEVSPGLNVVNPNTSLSPGL